MSVGNIQLGKLYSNPYARAFKPQPVVEVDGGDHEVGMAQGQLDYIIKSANELKQKLGVGEKNIPGWIQDHISKAHSYLHQANSGHHELGESKKSMKLTSLLSEGADYEGKKFKLGTPAVYKDGGREYSGEVVMAPSNQRVQLAGRWVMIGKGSMKGIQLYGSDTFIVPDDWNDVKPFKGEVKSTEEGPVSEAKEYKKGDKLKIKLPNGKKFDVVFDMYSNTKGVALGKFKNDDGEYNIKPFGLDTIVEVVINEDTRRVKLLGIDFKVSEINGKIFFSFVDKKAASVQLRQVGTNKIVNHIQKRLDIAYGKGEFFFKGGDHAEFQNGYLFQRSIGNINLNKLKFEEVVTEEDKSAEEILKGLRDMAMGDLERIEDYAEMIADRMKQGQELSSWMYSQITLAVDQLNAVHDAMDGKDGIKESELKGYLAADVVDDIVKSIGSKFVKGHVENAPNKNFIYLKLTDIKFGSGVVKILKSQFGIDAKIDKTFGNIPTVSFPSNKVISEVLTENKMNAYISSNDGKTFTIYNSNKQKLKNVSSQELEKLMRVGNNYSDSMGWKEFMGKFDKTTNLGKHWKYWKGTLVNVTIPSIGENKSVKEDIEPQTKKIASLTGTRADAVEQFVSTHGLNITKLVKFIEKGKLSDRMDFVSAIAGKPNNPIQKKIIKMFSEAVNEATEPEIITQLRDIVKNQQYQVLKDPKTGKKVKVDMQSANVIVKVYDALGTQNKEKFSNSGLMGMQSTAFKLMR